MEPLLKLQECITIPPLLLRIPRFSRSLDGIVPGGEDGSDGEQQEPKYEHPVPVEKWSSLGCKVVKHMQDYLKDLENHKIPVQPNVHPGYLLLQLPQEAPAQPEMLQSILSDIDRLITPGLLQWQHPSFFGYFQIGNSVPAMLADIIVSAFSTCGFQWVSSPAATELEVLVLDWMVKLLHLPDHFLSTSPDGGGSIQGYASEGILVSLLAAKARALHDRPKEDCIKLVCYSSDQGHSCVVKAGMMAGILHFRSIPTDASTEYALQPDAYEAAIQADIEAGLIPFWTVATIGTTSSCAVDPVGELAVVSSQYGVWLHVDAAHAGSYALLPEQRELHFQGLELIDSYDMNPHKTLLTGIGVSLLYVKDVKWVRAALSITPEYLKPGIDVNTIARKIPDFKDWEVSLGTPFRALKLWLVLRMYGTQKLEELMQHRLRMQDYFVRLLKQKKSHFCLVEGVPPRFGLVCFRLANGSDEQTEMVMRMVNSSGEAFMVHTKLGGQFVIRLAIGSTTTQGKDIRNVFQALQNAADAVLTSKN